MSFFRRLTDERGVALPVAISILFVVAGLATVAARAAIVSNNQSFRDNNAKRAVQAASSGLQTAVYQTNLMAPSVTQCVHKNVSNGALTNAAVEADNWCQAQTEDLGDGASYSMRVSATSAETVSSTGIPIVQRTVVSTGTVNGATRRAVTTLNAAIGAPIFPPGYAAAVRDSIYMKNNAIIDGHLGSNGTITVKNNLDICGNITPGPGESAPSIGQNLTQCPGFNQDPAAEPFDLQPVDLNQASSNDNQRLTNMKASPPVSPQDTCSNCNNVHWSASTRVLTVDSGGVLTLAGDKYLVCSLNVYGKLQIPARSKPLYIYVDTPTNCGGGSGMGSVVFDGQLDNLYSPPEALAILVAGSSTTATTIDLPTTDADNPIGVYAPNSTVVLKNNVVFRGSIVSKSLDVKNNAVFAWDESIGDIRSDSGIRFYQAATGSYKECTSVATSTTPDSGC